VRALLRPHFSPRFDVVAEDREVFLFRRALEELVEDDRGEGAERDAVQREATYDGGVVGRR